VDVTPDGIEDFGHSGPVSDIAIDALLNFHHHVPLVEVSCQVKRRAHP
jgi:hypothetical protein